MLQVPLMSIDLDKWRAIEGINMLEYNVCIFMNLNVVAFSFPVVNLFSSEITSAV